MSGFPENRHIITEPGPSAEVLQSGFVELYLHIHSGGRSLGKGGTESFIRNLDREEVVRLVISVAEPFLFP